MKYWIVIIYVLFISCFEEKTTMELVENNKVVNQPLNLQDSIVGHAQISKPYDKEEEKIMIYKNSYQKIKLSKGINTKQNEYYPVPNSNGSVLYFPFSVA